MAGQVTQYDPKAFEYLREHAVAIDQTATKLGVPATAIAAAMAEEAHAYAINTTWNAFWDATACNRGRCIL